MMYFLIYFTLFTYNLYVINCENSTNVTEKRKCNKTAADYTDNPTVHDIGETLISLLPSNNDTKRISELKEKLLKIDSYVVDREKYAVLLSNATRHNHLNKTSFYDALVDIDHLNKINNETKPLYLKIKERMNRDDVLKILSEKAHRTKVLKSARRMMSDARPVKPIDFKVQDVVDRYLAESPADGHKYNETDRYIKHWDPQAELEERKAHRRFGGRRLFKGERTTVRYYPFMVSIQVMGRFWCGGVLYSGDLVITSASCLQLMHNNRFFRENPKMLAVRVGSNHSRIGGELVEALEVFFHPAYNPRTLNNNIALIRMLRSVHMTYHRVPKIIEVSDIEDGIGYTAEVLLLGWGVTKTSQKLAFEPIYLQRKFLPVYPATFCKEVYGSKFIRQTMFCAGTMTTGEGACDHDAGGPAILNGKLVGIISFGPTICGFPDAPTVFTLAGAYLDWIETVNTSMPHYNRGHKRTTTTTVDPFIEYFNTATMRSTQSDKIYVTMPKRIVDALTGSPVPEIEVVTTPAPTGAPIGRAGPLNSGPVDVGLNSGPVDIGINSGPVDVGKGGFNMSDLAVERSHDRHFLVSPVDNDRYNTEGMFLRRDNDDDYE